MDRTDIQESLKKVPLFQGLSPRDYDPISKAMIHRKFESAGVIVHEEDLENQTFFIIISGEVHVTVLSTEGKQTILATLRPGDFFGEMSILDGEPRSATVVAAANCELLMLYRKSFLDIMQTYPKIAIHMLITMSRRLRRSNRHINTLSKMSVYGRVADVILQLANEKGERIGDMIMIHNPPTHQELAEMAGTSRETVSRILSQLRKKHYITADRKKMVVLNEEELYD